MPSNQTTPASHLPEQFVAMLKELGYEPTYDGINIGESGRVTFWGNPSGPVVIVRELRWGWDAFVQIDSVDNDEITAAVRKHVLAGIAAFEAEGKANDIKRARTLDR